MNWDIVKEIMNDYKEKGQVEKAERFWNDVMKGKYF